MNRYLRYWLPLFTYCLFIFFLSSYPNPLPMPHLFLGDKLLHIAEYSILGFLMARSIFSLNLRYSNPQITQITRKKRINDPQITPVPSPGATGQAQITRKLKTKRLLLFIIAVTLSTLYGLSDEVHQSFTPGRTTSLGDLIADGLGSLIGAVLYLKMLSKYRSRV